MAPVHSDSKGPLHPLSILIRRHSAKRIAEIGILYGSSARRVLKECDDQGIELYLMVDPWLPYNDGSSTGRKSTAESMEAMYQDNVKKMQAFPEARIIRKKSVEAAASIPNGSLDIVYIDAAHDTFSVLSDIHA